MTSNLDHPFFNPLSSIDPHKWLAFFEIPSLEQLPLKLDCSWHPLSYSYCKKNEVLPFGLEEKRCLVATTDPLNLQKAKYLSFILDKTIDMHYCSKTLLLDAIEKTFFPNQKKAEDVIASLTSKTKHSHESLSVDLLEEQLNSSTTIRLLNSILQNAIQQFASDIHFESTQKGLNIRYRIDGVLQERHFLESHYQSGLFTRLKILSHLDIAEQRRPQDGRFQLTIGQKNYDFRLSTLPTSHGERLVLRILDPSRMNLNLKKLGVNRTTLEKLMPMISRREGLFLVTGPTGSGKTTTLYSIIKEIQSPSLNIMTIEDPVEYQISSISQMNVHPAIGLTFSKGLKHILRQDPDIILIGEIRDFETAQIALQAALTGHLVLSTLHTHDSVSSITRLIEMGIEPYLVSSALIGVLAQRLIRKICPSCKSRIEQTHFISNPLFPQYLEQNSFKGLGCEHCFQTGYLGRMGLYELLSMSPNMKQATFETKLGAKLLETAQKEGLQTLYQQGIDAVEQGKTSLDEVLRICQPDQEPSE